MFENMSEGKMAIFLGHTEFYFATMSKEKKAFLKNLHPNLVKAYGLYQNLSVDLLRDLDEMWFELEDERGLPSFFEMLVEHKLYASVSSARWTINWWVSSNREELEMRLTGILKIQAILALYEQYKLKTTQPKAKRKKV